MNASETNFRVLVVGNPSVGKTQMIRTCMGHPFEEVKQNPKEEDLLYTKHVKGDLSKIVLDVVDSPGAAGRKSISPSFFRNTNCVLVVYDVSNQESFSAVSQWIEEIAGRVSQNTTITVIGNKADLQRTVTTAEGEALAGLFGFAFFETSAKTHSGIEGVFHSLIKKAETSMATSALQSNIRTTRGSRLPNQKRLARKKSPTCPLL